MYIQRGCCITKRNQKIKALNNYCNIKMRVNVLLERKRAYQNDIYGIKAVQISDMPKSHKNSDLGDKVAQYCSVTSDIDREINFLTKKMKFIRDVIKRTKDLKMLSVLEMRFVDGFQRKQIASVLNLSVSQVDYLINQAVDVLLITNNDIDNML